MKLKKALKLAKLQGFKWVAVDKDLTVYMYTNEPIGEPKHEHWNTDGGLCSDFGIYTGNKDWKETLREVK